MAEQPPLKPPPSLQPPPGYKNPSVPVQPAQRLPPRKPVLPPSFQPKKKRRSFCRTSCCFCCVFIFILIFLLALAGAFFYLWYNPKIPVFHLQSIRTPQFNVTVKSDVKYLDAHTVARVEVKNPNGKLALYYGTTRVDLTVGDDTRLGSTSFPGFTQAKNNATSLRIETRVSNEMVDDAVGSKLKSGFRSKALVVSVEVKTRLGLRVEGWKVGTVPVNVRCGGVSLKKLEGGEMPKCTINLLKWINIH